MLSRAKIREIVKRHRDTDPDVVLLADMAERHRQAVRRAREPKLSSPLECTQCGRCCLKYGDCLTASEEDVQRWEQQERDDILAYVGLGADLWIGKLTGEEVSRCPWLRKLPGKNKYICRIHDTKPKVCKGYPVSRKQAIEDGCPSVSFAQIMRNSRRKK